MADNHLFAIPSGLLDPADATPLTGRCPVTSPQLPGYRHRLLRKLRPALRRARCDAPYYIAGPPLCGDFFTFLRTCGVPMPLASSI